MYEFFQFQSGVCSNNILIQTKIGELVISQVKVLQPSNQTQPYMFTLTLHPNQHFNFTIIACNTYGNVSFSTSVSKSSATEGNCKFLCISIYTVGTHSVIAINISTTPVTEITCIFNAGSHAIGCLINLTNLANGITYCIVLQQFFNISESNFLILETCNATLHAGRYLLKAYGIEKDGNISQLPAVIEEVLLEISAVMVPEF